jgi:hypothetical protein
MRHDAASRPPKVAIYDRPASADRPHRRWLVWIIAALGTAAWGAYLLWAR